MDLAFDFFVSVLPKYLFFEAHPKFAAIPVTVMFIAPAGGLYWLFVVDAFRRMRYAITGNESAGPKPFVLSLFALSFALGALSFLQTTGWALAKEDGYATYSGGEAGGILFAFFMIPALGLVLVFYVGMALSGGDEPPLREWLDRWRPKKKLKKKDNARKTHIGWAWFRLIIWIPCVSMAVSAAGIGAAAIGRVLIGSFVDLANS